MTTDERRALTTYRQQGYGCKKIAQIMELSVNTVKTYCKRNALGGVVAPQNPRSIEKVCISTVAHPWFKLRGRNPGCFALMFARPRLSVYPTRPSR